MPLGHWRNRKAKQACLQQNGHPQVEASKILRPNGVVQTRLEIYKPNLRVPYQALSWISMDLFSYPPKLSGTQPKTWAAHSPSGMTRLGLRASNKDGIELSSSKAVV